MDVESQINCASILLYSELAMRLILASTSPRRREILSLLGIPFEVIAPDFDEVPSPHIDVRDEVSQFAAGKARSVLRHNPRSIVIGGDTMISIEGKKIGKPADLADAKGMLRTLSGRSHRIYTSVAIVEDLGGNESLDKAGAYSIQSRGSHLVDCIEGDYLAAVGLPLKPVAEYLNRRGLTFPLDIDGLYRDKSYLIWQSFYPDPH